MFSTGRVYTTPDGKRFDRPTVDPDLLGFDALYRLYETSEGWLCLAVFTPREWDALTTAIPAVAQYSLAARNDESLAAALETHFRTDTAANWFKVLDQAGVPCEVSSVEFSENFLDDPEMLRLEWAVQREGHPVHGRVDMVGRWVDFSGTPTVIAGPPPVPGQHSREILQRFGWSDERIDALVAANAVFEAKQ
jgi:crotonobetainyl-CoA:carnitine CoA-transferase CaiB-like acyl-CoA transferase